jgi:type I restriction enzyme S subunit
MMMFRLIDMITPKYFMYYFQSDLFKSQFRPLITGTTAPHLNIRDIKRFNVIACPIEEQLRIVQEIESRLSVTDKAEETINQSLLQAETLRQSILKQAFEGKLV